MFNYVVLRKELEIHPRFFGPRLEEEVTRRLRQEVRGMHDALATAAAPCRCCRLPALWMYAAGCRSS